jgi:hypothetical protein
MPNKTTLLELRAKDGTLHHINPQYVTSIRTHDNAGKPTYHEVWIVGCGGYGTYSVLIDTTERDRLLARVNNSL